MSEAPRFGTAGLSDSYRVRSFDPQAMAEYTASFGLTAFEYQCGRGVRLGLDKAAASCLYTQIPESRINTELFNYHQKTE